MFTQIFRDPDIFVKKRNEGGRKTVKEGKENYLKPQLKMSCFTFWYLTVWHYFPITVTFTRVCNAEGGCLVSFNQSYLIIKEADLKSFCPRLLHRNVQHLKKLPHFMQLLITCYCKNDPVKLRSRIHHVLYPSKLMQPLPIADWLTDCVSLC